MHIECAIFLTSLFSLLAGLLSGFHRNRNKLIKESFPVTAACPGLQILRTATGGVPARQQDFVELSCVQAQSNATLHFSAVAEPQAMNVKRIGLLH